MDKTVFGQKINIRRVISVQGKSESVEASVNLTIVACVTIGLYSSGRCFETILGVPHYKMHLLLNYLNI